MAKCILIGFLPPVGGLPKTEEFFDYHEALINTGDIAYTLAGTLLAAGKNHTAWNFSASAEIVNEHFSHVVFFLPCRIAEPPFHLDGYPYAMVTEFIENLKIPFTSVTESIQSSSFEYQSDFHKRLAPEVVRYLKVMADKSQIVGTRGEYSAEVLNKLGITNVEPVGCPSLFINGPALNASLLDKKPFRDLKNIAVTYSNYQMGECSLIRDILSLAVAHDYYYVEQSSNLVPKLLYYPHKIEAADFLKAHQWYGGLDQLRALFNQNKIRYFTNYQNWKDFLSQMDFVFGARMHGHTPALQSGVPAYFISHDSRTREMFELFKLPFASEHSFSGTGFNAEDIYERTDYHETVKVYPERYRNFIRFLSRNRLTPNCNEDLSIRETIDGSPSPGVEMETNPATDSEINQRFANVIFNLGQSIAQQGKVDGYERLVETCGRLWRANSRRMLRIR